MTQNQNRPQVSLSFEFFPPKNDDMDIQLFTTAKALADWQPEFVSVTYGAGGTTRDTTLGTVGRLISDLGLPAASHLTCVGASRAEVDHVIDQTMAKGCRRFVALRGDPQSGVGTAYQPHPEGYVNAADLVAGLAARGVSDISVSAYPEKHPESTDVQFDVEMLKRKVDNGATRAITQFFFDNDDFERYLERVRAAGISIPIVPGILPIQNLAQVRRFAGACGASVPAFVAAALEPWDDQPVERAARAAELAGRQIADLIGRGIGEFHLYTMNRAPLVEASLAAAGLKRPFESSLQAERGRQASAA